MEANLQTIYAKQNRNISIGIIPGHFATSHSHVNYYLDVTGIKSVLRMAKLAGSELARKYRALVPVDTILCLEGSEIVGAFLADDLVQPGLVGINVGKDISLLTPELNVNNQLVFHDNTQSMVQDKNVLLLLSSVSTGKTLLQLTECLDYYGGRLVGISAIFSAARESRGTPINSIFTEADIPDYTTYKPVNCPLCNGGKKIDALISGSGYFKYH